MQIEGMLDKGYKKISEIEIGETFIYNDNLCIKIQPDYYEIEEIKAGFNNVILDLHRNKLNALREYVEVKPITARIVL